MVNRCLIQTDAWAGSSAWCTAVSRWAWTVSESAASAEAGLIKSEIHRLAGIARSGGQGGIFPPARQLAAQE